MTGTELAKLRQSLPSARSTQAAFARFIGVGHRTLQGYEAADEVPAYIDTSARALIELRARMTADEFSTFLTQL